MKPSVIYLRKSRSDIQAEAQGELETLSRHEATLTALAKTRNIPIAAIYREVVSGDSISERPMVQQLIREVENAQWESVLVMDIDRLARGDTIDQGIIAQTFRYSGTKIVTPAKTYDPNNEFDEEFFEFGLFMARREYKAINRRMQRGREASVREGKYVSSSPPYGYTKIKLENAKGFTLKINEEEAAVVRMIFSLYTVGLPDENGECERIGVGKIVRYLNDAGFKPKKRDTWTSASVRDLLQNPVYIGKVRWNWRPVKWKIEDGQKVSERPKNTEDSCILTDGLHEPIISRETWELAQKFMKQNPPRPIPIDSRVKNPLAGLVICGKCGRRMVRRPYGERQPASLICPYTECDNVSAYLHTVEKRVLNSLRGWVTDFELEWKNAMQGSHAAQQEYKKNALKQAEANLKALQKKMNHIYELLEEGTYSSEVFLERSKKLQEEMTRAEKQKEVLESELRTAQIHIYNKKKLIPKIEKLLDVYWTLEDPKHKNDMLKEVIEKIEYRKEKRGSKYNPNDDFELVLYPKIADED